VERIERKWLEVRGNNKLEKEYAWVKDKGGEVFRPIEEGNRFKKK
jgi:predicted 3-demethylubiquinone-9 3-methyltransferase (glyoxalase superfamily)